MGRGHSGADVAKRFRLLFIQIVLKVFKAELEHFYNI